ncbi:TetR family transcriptional regulator [Thermogemmatispora aurantia]|uniref:TetR family transcriptional regulator n=1 Tax=Thermogemmatispora aurantia TaxID=2045279 RepID=A0A5J4KBJ6_9CHLR|nr:TetR/AcrR family transcriptional regulator [Thermogemmatispora aurantia]GER84031.1 TetR family transcriptional regulator [Thermogemmatispora aurantia]
MPKIVDEQTREATRQRILRVAASEFARLGFEQTNINLIAEQAGIGKGTIYLYFENKRALFLEMLRFIAQAHLREIRAALVTGDSLRQRLEALFLAFVRLAEQESDSFHVFMSALYGVNRIFQQEAAALLREYVAAIAHLLAEGRACGAMKVPELEASALMVLSVTESYVLAARVLGYPASVLASQAGAVADFVLHGLGTSDSHSGEREQGE